MDAQLCQKDAQTPKKKCSSSKLLSKETKELKGEPNHYIHSLDSRNCSNDVLSLSTVPVISKKPQLPK
jgi:hypothetical protein